VNYVASLGWQPRGVEGVTGRPEGSGDYNALPEDHAAYGNRDSEAWRDFEPYRPGDRPTQPTFTDDVKSALGSFLEKSETPERSSTSTHHIQTGDTVRNVRCVGGVFGGEVPEGTKGKVVGIEHGLMSEHVTVQFENGYRETLDSSGLKYESGWY
jgi:hypothetical protein